MGPRRVGPTTYASHFQCTELKTDKAKENMNEPDSLKQLVEAETRRVVETFCERPHRPGNGTKKPFSE